LKIKKVRSDNGTAFKNTGVEEFLGEEGIKYEFSVPYTPQQNGVVERRIELSLRPQEPCYMSTRHRTTIGWRPSTPHAMQSIVYIFRRSTRRPVMNFSPVTNQS
jgi:transposase InsO family protein